MMKMQFEQHEKFEKIRNALKSVSGLRYNLSKVSEWHRMITDQQNALAEAGFSATRTQVHRALTSDKFNDVWDEAEYLCRVCRPL